VNKQARATTGCFRTTNRGALAMESGLRPATAQLENRQRRFGLRLLSLPDGDQAREVVGARSGIGGRLKNALALAHRGRTETTVLLEEPEALEAETIQEDEETAKAEAERSRLGLTMFTDGSRLDSGATGYAVAWQKGQSWVGIKNHMGYNQEAYDAECAALARALEEAAKRRTAPERVTIFTDAQAAIRRMASEDPGPGQKYAILARRHIAALRRARPSMAIEIRWCPAHKGVPGNEKADEWAKLAAEEPEARGVERLQGGARPVPLPRSLAHIKREISTKKWDEAPMGGETDLREEIQDAAHAAAGQDSGRKQQEGCRKVLPDQDWALPYRGIPGVDKEPSVSPVLVVQVQEADKGACLQELRTMEGTAESAVEGTAESAVEGGVEGDWERKETVRDPGLLELLLAAPAWRAGGSVTTATATTATLWRAMASQRQWQRDPGNDGLAFSHSSVFGILSSLLLYTSI